MQVEPHKAMQKKTFNSSQLLRNYCKQEESITSQTDYWPHDFSTSPLAIIIIAE